MVGDWYLRSGSSKSASRDGAISHLRLEIWPTRFPKAPTPSGHQFMTGEPRMATLPRAHLFCWQSVDQLGDTERLLSDTT